MGWLTRIDRPRPCCKLPSLGAEDAKNYWIGSTWMCPKCDKVWEIYNWTTAGNGRDFVPSWRDKSKPWPPEPAAKPGRY